MSSYREKRRSFLGKKYAPPGQCCMECKKKPESYAGKESKKKDKGEVGRLSKQSQKSRPETESRTARGRSVGAAVWRGGEGIKKAARISVGMAPETGKEKRNS